MKEFSPYFKLRNEPTEELIALLKSVVLGTNGTKYRHLDTSERIKEIDNPLFLTLERREKILGNVTFCRREKDWYIRYFAFSASHQSSEVKSAKARTKHSMLKGDLENFFQHALEGKLEDEVDNFYAYIDPKNDKSLRMAVDFNFIKCSEIATQTFSRLYPSSSKRLVKLEWDQVKKMIHQEYAFHRFYHTELTSKGPVYGLVDGNKILAFAKVTSANWQIERLPGRFGSVLVSILPRIPILRSLFNPKDHKFLVPEAVYVRSNDPKLLTELFEGILAHHGMKTIIWWVDKHDPTYRKLAPKVRWGLLNRIVGVNEVNVMVRSKQCKEPDDQTPTYVIGLDFV